LSYKRPGRYKFNSALNNTTHIAIQPSLMDVGYYDLVAQTT
jgi:hypothetical protein